MTRAARSSTATSDRADHGGFDIHTLADAASQRWQHRYSASPTRRSSTSSTSSTSSGNHTELRRSAEGAEDEAAEAFRSSVQADTTVERPRHVKPVEHARRGVTENSRNALTAKSSTSSASMPSVTCAKSVPRNAESPRRMPTLLSKSQQLSLHCRDAPRRTIKPFSLRHGQLCLALQQATTRQRGQRSV